MIMMMIMINSNNNQWSILMNDFLFFRMFFLFLLYWRRCVRVCVLYVYVNVGVYSCYLPCNGPMINNNDDYHYKWMMTKQQQQKKLTKKNQVEWIEKYVSHTHFTTKKSEWINWTKKKKNTQKSLTPV